MVRCTWKQILEGGEVESCWCVSSVNGVDDSGRSGGTFRPTGGIGQNGTDIETNEKLGQRERVK
jgi:hypothetical protein